MPSGPTLTLTLPSIRDSTAIDLRVYYCASLAATNPKAPLWRRHAAVVAHPYAPMGGCYDDAVVEAIAGKLLQAGYLVVTFNFRGAGRSAGRTSWTAKPESDDFASIIAFAAYFTHYLDPFRPFDATEKTGSSPHGLNGSLITSSALGDEFVPFVAYGPQNSTAANLFPEASDAKLLKSAPLLIVAGYSYGALVASRLPPLADILEPMIEPKVNSPAAQIRRRVECLAAQQNTILGRARANALKSTPPTKPNENSRLDCVRQDSKYEGQGQTGKRSFSERPKIGIEDLPSSGRVDTQTKEEVNAEPQSSTCSNDRTPGASTCQQPETEEMVMTKSTAAQESTGLRDAVLLPKAHTFTNPVPTYLLVSPLVGLIAQLALFKWPAMLTRRGRKSASQLSKSDKILGRLHHVDTTGQAQSHERDRDLDATEVKLTRNPTLALYGDGDIFVPVGKLHAWTTRLKSVRSSQFDAHEIQSGGHFWVDKFSMGILQDRIERFATELIERQNGEERKFG